MTREQLSIEALKESQVHKTMVYQLATGAGKSKLAIDTINYNMFGNPRVLILVAQSPHKKNWQDELTKWQAKFTPIIECYASLKKYVGQVFDFVICDEVQHLSEARREIFDTLTINNNIVALSATVPKQVKDWLRWKHHAFFMSLSTAEAIESDILPDPIIYKIPLQFKDNLYDETLIVNPAKKGETKPVKCLKYTRQLYWQCKQLPKVEWHLYCTSRDYYNNMTNLIEWYKKKHREMPMLRESSKRLNWLAHKKNDVIKAILEALQDQRTITFCTDIAQTEAVGSNCIHSKNKYSQDVLDAFNSKKIDHITTCHMADEGLNLTDCRIGIFANLNASEIIAIQRIGRVLRHKKPIIIIPYFVGTRDEELVNKHLEGYNPKLIKTITNYKQIKL